MLILRSQERRANKENSQENTAHKLAH